MGFVKQTLKFSRLSQCYVKNELIIVVHPGTFCVILYHYVVHQIYVSR